MRMEIEGFCEKGALREENQDSIFAAKQDDAAIVVVADGMGGHQDGKRASSVICAQIQDWWENLPLCWKTPRSARKKELEAVIQRANHTIWSYTKEGCCGSTVVVLWLERGNWSVFSVGDSRCYRTRRSFGRIKISQVTQDEVWEEQEEVKRRFQKEQMKNHPNFGKLIRAVGVSSSLFCHVTAGRISFGMSFFLCSDGIYRYCQRESLERALLRIEEGNSIREEIERVRTEVYNNNAPDNLSLIAVRVR